MIDRFSKWMSEELKRCNTATIESALQQSSLHNVLLVQDSLVLIWFGLPQKRIKNQRKKYVKSYCEKLTVGYLNFYFNHSIQIKVLEYEFCGIFGRLKNITPWICTNGNHTRSSIKVLSYMRTQDVIKWKNLACISFKTCHNEKKPFSTGPWQVDC